jgi:hypothetical protein
MPDVTHLLQAAVSSYRSPDSNGSNGAVGLSKLMGISNGILSRKVSPNDPACHLSPAELVKVCKETGDHAALVAMAMELGYVLMPLEVDLADDATCAMGKTFKESGEWLQKASAANAKPNLTPNELDDLQRELFESFAQDMRMFSLLKAKCHGQRPSHLRAA